MSKKTFNDRKDDEKKEGYDTVKTDLPDTRFQDEKQVLKPEEMGVTKSSIPGTGEQVSTANIATVDKVRSKIKIRPDVSVEELKNTNLGGVPLAAAPGLRGVAGVSSQSPVDDTSKIPYTAGGYRPSTRYGKKRSEDLFEMDQTISEQVNPIVDDAKDLREAPDAKQGYNGRKQFNQTRAKKNFKTSVNDRLPQQLLNDVSMDLIENDKIIYTSGQIIDGVDSQADYPTVRNDGQNVNFIMHKSNYKPKALRLKILNNRIAKVSIDEDRFDVPADPVTRDQSNMNWQVDQNNVAKSMIKLQTELGRETTDKWSPLGYVINQPYQHNMLMHDIENEVAAMQAIAYRSAVSAMAFQRNILGKDGVNPQRNAVKMILEGYAGDLADSTASTISDTDFSHVIFNQGEYRKGSAAAIIAMFDSTGKYKTKADILGLQRSWPLHLSQADNNINPLHCKPNFIKLLDKAHMFSTVDGGYNPMLPIHVTKRIKLVNNVSLNAFLAGWKNPASFTTDDQNDPLRDKETGTLANYAYEYNDIRNKYVTRVQHPLIEGLLMWLLRHEGAIVSTFGENASNSDTDDIVIPFEFNFETPSLISLILCSASQYVLYQRNRCYRDVLFAGEQSTYIWDDLQGLDKLNPLFSTQLTIGKYDAPLKLGKLAPDTAIREMWGTHMQLSDTQSGVGKDAKAQYFLPWYMNEHALTNSYTNNEGFNNEPTAYNMSIPSIRDGVRHEYVDLIKGMEERDVRLALDRWTRIPLFVVDTVVNATISGATVKLWTEHTTPIVSADINAYIKLAALRYDLNSDGRVVACYQVEDGNKTHNLTEFSLLATPKELGFIEDCYDPIPVITGMSYSNANNTKVLTLTTTTLEPTNTYDGGKAYSGMTPLRLVSYRVQGDSNTDAAIDRAMALSQVFYRCFAAEDATTINQAFVAKVGMMPCLSYDNAATIEANAIFTLNGSTAASSMINTKVRTLSPRIWTLLQRFMMPVNKFENCFTNTTGETDYDPLESTIYFGVCGFLASDFTQDVLERLDINDQLGLDYTEDVFVKSSLLFR